MVRLPRELRSLCRVRNGTLYERLTALTDAGQIVRGPRATGSLPDLDLLAVVGGTALNSALNARFPLPLPAHSYSVREPERELNLE